MSNLDLWIDSFIAQNRMQIPFPSHVDRLVVITTDGYELHRFVLGDESRVKPGISLELNWNPLQIELD